MNSVPARPSANEDHFIARPLLATLGDIPGQQSESATVYQWIGHIALIKENGTVERGYAEPVGVVGHPGPHPLEHAARVKHALRQFMVR